MTAGVVMRLLVEQSKLFVSGCPQVLRSPIQAFDNILRNRLLSDNSSEYRSDVSEGPALLVHLVRLGLLRAECNENIVPAEQLNRIRSCLTYFVDWYSKDFVEEFAIPIGLEGVRVAISRVGIGRLHHKEVLLEDLECFVCRSYARLTDGGGGISSSSPGVFYGIDDLGQYEDDHSCDQCEPCSEREQGQILHSLSIHLETIEPGCA